MTSTSEPVSNVLMDGSHVESGHGTRRSHYAILVDASGLPDEAGKLILSTVRQTRLSPGEQACVAEELIAHFADGLEAGVPLDDLVKRFGDARTIATLIRRAKQRCCPRPRFTIAAVQLGLASIVALCVGFSYFIAIFITPKLQAIYHHAGIDLPDYFQVTNSAAVFLDRFYLGFILLAAMVGWFEWKCRSEHKGLLRTGMFVGLSLVCALMVLWWAFVHIVVLATVAVLAAAGG